MGGRNGSEQVAGMDRNRWPEWIGMGGRNHRNRHYEGKPLEGAKIYGGGKRKDALKTGPDGIANVVIGEVGNHKIGALHKIPLHNNPDADYLVRTTNLTFEVKQ